MDYFCDFWAKVAINPDKWTSDFFSCVILNEVKNLKVQSRCIQILRDAQDNAWGVLWIYQILFPHLLVGFQFFLPGGSDVSFTFSGDDGLAYVGGPHQQVEPRRA